jgi:protein involved in polysaccharide export with SLBB domain
MLRPFNKSPIIALICAYTFASFAQEKSIPELLSKPAANITATTETRKSVNFRPSAATLNVDAPPMQSGGGSATKRVNLMEELADRRDSLEGEIKYGKGKIDAAKKRSEILKSLGKIEETERMNNEVKDWQARINNSREQLAQVEDEIAKAKKPNQEETSLEIQNGEEVILPGNNLEMWVNEDTSFNGRYQVRRGGYIIVPQIGRVIVAGKTITQAESAIRKALQATQLKQASVTLERFEGVSDEPGPLIYLSGEFKHPRPYRVPKGTSPTIISVLLSSGGWTERADLSHVKVMRMAANRSVVEEVNVKKILEANPSAGGLGADLTLTEGDVLVIPSGAMNLIYVTGRVRKAGSYRLNEGEKLTAYGVILQSGGFNSFADKDGVHILRSMPDGTKAKLPASIKDIEKGRRPDIVLQANDIVVVPEKWFSW